ncbi:PARP-domain-containing protein [Cubamyces sp. BRFM 1775]|nr:PARP-domain-containing protein [Cubamyces sp. BRFM 1775]
MRLRGKTTATTADGATKPLATHASARIRTRSVAKAEAVAAVAAAASAPPSSRTLAASKPPTKTKAKTAPSTTDLKGKGKRTREGSDEEEDRYDGEQEEEEEDKEDKKSESKRVRKVPTASHPGTHGKDKYTGSTAVAAPDSAGGKRKKSANKKAKDVAGSPQKFVHPGSPGAAPPVDPMSNLADTHEVLVTPEGVWNAMLNQTNVGKNANKFYILQLLHPVGNSSNCLLYTHWGRVGENGQFQTKGPWAPATAADMFKKQFKAKAGVSWEQRIGMLPKKGKYVWLERSYDDDEEAKQNGNSKSCKSSTDVEVEEKIPESTLPHEIQVVLCRLIFDSSLLDAHLSSMNYDANKLPLGKLAKSTILAGFSILKMLAEVIFQNGGTTALSPVELGPVVEELTGRYYSIIPHVFGRERPIVIDRPDRLKKELELVDALGDLEVASKLIASTISKDADGRAINPLDTYFRSLQLSKMEPVPRVGSEFAALETYTCNTDVNGAGAHRHYDSIEVLQAFRVERVHETEAWLKAGYGSVPDGDRLLLWHGSRTTNFVGILKQGLRIAPPAAPATGYMFGKGVYFADVMSKSANYCHACLSDNTGLLLLCEVAAKPFFEQYQENCNAGQDCKKAGARSTKGLGRSQPSDWQDAGAVLNNPELRGCYMPKGPMVVSDQQIHLHHNEYIAYDVSQIRLRYLLMVKMT